MVVAERECKSCGAELAFVRSEAGRWMPLDLAPDPAGNIVLRGAVAHILQKGESSNEPRYLSHFVTCPEAGIFRREGQQGRSAA